MLWLPRSLLAMKTPYPRCGSTLESLSSAHRPYTTSIRVEKLHTAGVLWPTALAHCVNTPSRLLAPLEVLGGKATWALGLILHTGSLSVGICRATAGQGILASFPAFLRIQPRSESLLLQRKAITYSGHCPSSSTRLRKDNGLAKLLVALWKI